MQTLLALPPRALILLSALAVAQLSLQVWGVIDLTRRVAEPGRRKWIWALVIVFGGFVGSLVYLGVGRGALGDASDDGDASANLPERRTQAIDRLYGDRDA